MRTVPCVWVLLLAAAPARAQEEKPREAAPPYRFVHITDIHFEDSGRLDWGVRNAKGFGEFVAFMNETMKPDLVVLTGDLVQDITQERPFKDLPPTEHVSQLRKFKEALAKLRAPCAVVGGNHDWTEFEEIFGHRNTRHDGPVAFVGLGLKHTNRPLGWGVFEDADWLKKQLDGESIVFLHHPLDFPTFQNPGAVRKILEDSGKVKLVLQGHLHGFRDNPQKGIHYVTGPMFGTKGNGFLVGEIHKDRIEIVRWGREDGPWKPSGKPHVIAR
ncbi:MAG: metallophosphoesterase [Planctomycetes bacterium]|nr:metallophosphoesterase [Planctomycetota bacterium]